MSLKNPTQRSIHGQDQYQPDTMNNAMNVQGHYRLAQTLHVMLTLPPLVFIGLTWWVLPQLPMITPEQHISLETPLLGATLLSAVLCDTLFYVRLRRFRALPNIGETTRVPPALEARRGWIACGVSWGFAQLYVIFGVIEALFTRELSALWVFVGFAAITLYRCRPRHGLFAAFNWGTSAQLQETQFRDAELQDTSEPNV